MLLALSLVSVIFCQSNSYQNKSKIEYYQSCSKAQCTGNQKLYTELGCSPVLKKGNCCPIRYNCPNIKLRDVNKCFLSGKQYNVKEDLPEEIANKFCAPTCKCNK